MSVSEKSALDPLSIAEDLLTKNASHVKQPKADVNLLKLGHSIRMPLWFSTTDAFSLDFSVKAEPDKPSEPLSFYPVHIQERILLKELIGCMTGVNGQYVNVAGCDGKVVFDVEATGDPALRELAERCLAICPYYSNVSSFIERYGWFDSGLVNQSLVMGIRETFEDYLLFVGQLESQYVSGTLTLQRMFYFVEQVKPVLVLLDSVCNGVKSGKTFGGRTLAVLQASMDSCDGQATAMALLHHLAAKASVPLFKMVQNWISRGVICDPYGEFFIQENKAMGDKEKLGDIFPETCWEQQYTIKDDLVPPTLESFKRKILDTGKYINVLRECGTNYDCPTEKELIYGDGVHEYGKVIDDAFRFSSRMVVDVLLNKYHLMAHLKSLKRFFLLEAGDFGIMFLDLAEDELCKSRNETWTSRLQMLVDLAVQSSSCAADPNGEFIRAEIKQSFILQLLRVLSFETNVDSAAQHHAEIEEVNPTVFESFSLNFDVKWPLSIITNQRVILSYQLLFRHLFYCKLIEHQLCSVWVSNKFLKLCSIRDARWYAMVFALRNRMLAFVQNLIHYTTIEVIEPHWRAFDLKMRKVQTLGEVLALHHDFLAACLTDSLLLNLDFCRMLYKLLSACVVFTNHVRALSQSTVEVPVTVPSASTSARMRIQVTGKVIMSRLHDLAVDPEFQLLISKKEVEFRRLFGAFLNALTKDPTAAGGRLINIIQRMDYNGFYSEDANLHANDAELSALDAAAETSSLVGNVPVSSGGLTVGGGGGGSLFDISAVSSLQSDSM